jgi:hypothetical protein
LTGWERCRRGRRGSQRKGRRAADRDGVARKGTYRSGQAGNGRIVRDRNRQEEAGSDRDGL